MSDQSARLLLPFLQAAQAQKHVTHNEALERLDVLVQLVVEDFGASSPPIAPLEGEIWALGLAVSGDWAGHASELAAWMNGGWLFIAPQAGWCAVKGSDLRLWSGGEWVTPDLPALNNLDGVGVNTTYDGTNRLSVSSDATLFSHEGDDHRVKVNKALSADTASLLFQTGWSGRAEMGTSGGDDFSVKVSNDGTNWATALSVDAGSGLASFPAGLHASDGTPATPSIAFENAPGTGLYRPAVDTVALATAGAERLRVTSASVQIDVPVVGTAVTQSPTDTSAGRLMQVGDAGWLVDSPPTTALGAALISGTYAYAGSAADPDAPSVAGGTVLVQRSDVLFITQLAQSANDWNAFTRHSADGGSSWSSWSMLIGQRNAVGTVSQSASVPTGALIEAGTNANGSFTRFADGTQFCWTTLALASSPINVGFLGGFRNSGQTWAYPAAFGSPPSMVSGNPGALTSLAVVVNTANNTACSVFHTAFASQPAANLSARILAVGRWF